MTYDKMRKDYERMRDAEKTRIVDEWKAANDFCYVIHVGTGSMGQQIINSSLRVMNASDAMTWIMEMHL